MVDVVLLAVAGIMLALLFHPRIRNAPAWLATVTPLASIIGSGFLVVAPLLGAIVGKAAPLAMLAIVLLAYAVGAVIRFNIRHGEKLLASGQVQAINRVERLSDLALVTAYVISVAFYVRLLSAFVLRAADVRGPLAAQGLTTVILAFIGGYGLWRGLKGLERLEEYSVNVKLAVIAALLLGLAIFDVESATHSVAVFADPPRDLASILRALAGILLIVQGFETSRYLGDAYDPAMRVRTMRAAQMLAGLIYISFVLLALPLLPQLAASRPDETGIITLGGLVAPILPPMLIVAAMMSQFSASVADTLGAGGLLVENTRHHLRAKSAYGLIVTAAIALVWIADIFEIIALASRVFALYYALQCINAVLVARCVLKGGERLWMQAWFACLALVLLAVSAFAIPAGA